MGLFIECHLIQNFAPSNLNRDDTGSPKDAIFGGQRRARVSSQCFKRAVRLFFQQNQCLQISNTGIRTKSFYDLLLERFPESDRQQAGVKIKAILAKVKIKIEKKNNNKIENKNNKEKTEYLIFLSDKEIESVAEFIKSHADVSSLGSKEINRLKSLFDGGKAVDIALFGRMLADFPEANQYAACQVAHAISTHKVDREFDYYTAVDDVSGADETGAGMIGSIEFNSATFYRYAVLDTHKLLANLQNDQELTLSAIAAFTEAMVRAIPTGKQNSFAAHNPPDFIGISLRHASPLNLANAFEKPVFARLGSSLTEESVKCLSDYESKLAAIYGAAQDQWLYLDLTGQWPANKGARQASLAELVQNVRALAQRNLEPTI